MQTRDGLQGGEVWPDCSRFANRDRIFHRGLDLQHLLRRDHGAGFVYVIFYEVLNGAKYVEIKILCFC